MVMLFDSLRSRTVHTLARLPPPWRKVESCFRFLLVCSIASQLYPACWYCLSCFTEFGLPYTLVGHSERRHKVSLESDQLVNTKVLASLSAGLRVVLCFGETLQDREANKTMEVVAHQLKVALTGVAAPQLNNIVFAYEPVWAIGTGRTATPAQAQEVHAEIRKFLIDKYSDATAAASIIIYGGSVNPGNCTDLIKQSDIDGFLVGGCSLKPDFLKIIGSVCQHKNLSTSSKWGCVC